MLGGSSHSRPSHSGREARLQVPRTSREVASISPGSAAGAFAGCRLVVVEVREGEKIEMPLGQLSMLSLPFVSPLESGENPPQGFDVYVSLALRQR